VITFDSDFENGSLDRAIKLGENWYHLCLRPDTWYWFHCRIRGCKGKEIIFQFTCSPDIKSPGYEEGKGRWEFGEGVYNRPVVSYDKKAWEKVGRIEQDVQLPGTFRFRQTFREDEAYICYSYPYTYSDLTAWLETLVGNPLVSREAIGKTRNGLDQPCLTLTANQETRDLVAIIAREDADEVTTSFAVEGMVSVLLSEEASRALDKYVFEIVPMVSIDGVVAGSTFSGGYGFHTARWQESPSPPEIENVKQAVAGWAAQGYRFVLAGKMHGGQCIPKPGSGHMDIRTNDPRLRDVLTSTVDEYYHPRAQDLSLGFPGRYERYLYEEYGVRVTFSNHAQGEDPDGVRGYGRGLMRAILTYLSSA